MAAQLRVLICPHALPAHQGVRTMPDAADELKPVDTTGNGLHAPKPARAYPPEAVAARPTRHNVNGVELT